MYKIALYGKGGIGKSTIAVNIAAALSNLGLKVMQIGCDPKADSTSNLCGGVSVKTVLDAIHTHGNNVALKDIVIQGYNGVLCVEAGGPTPGLGCAGRGIITAFEKLEQLDAFQIYQPDIVIYDVLGDVVCGGFAMPIRNGYAEHVFVVTSGEKMSLYAAGNIALAIDNFKSRNYAKYSGVILNCRNVDDEYWKVAQFAKNTDSQLIAAIPRDGLVQEAELLNKTVVDAFAESELASKYRFLAKEILSICQKGSCSNDR